VHIVLQTEFLEGDGDLVAVGGCSTGRLARTFGWALRRLDVCFSPVWKPSVERMSGDSSRLGHRRTTGCVQVDVRVGCHDCLRRAVWCRKWRSVQELQFHDLGSRGYRCSS
jgi:hypothetical protein